jgi:photosystem II PsbH protein
MGQKTALGSLLKAIGNSGQGKVVPGWGAVPVMTVIGLLLLVFLVILLQIYNQSLLLQKLQDLGLMIKFASILLSL